MGKKKQKLWNALSWQGPSAWIFSLLLVFSLILSVYALYVSQTAREQIYPFIQKYEVQRLEVELDNFEIGGFSFPIIGDNYVISEFFSAEGYFPHNWQFVLYLLGLAMVFIVGFAGVSDLESWAFYVGFGLLVICLGLLKWQTLQLFGSEEAWTTGLVLALYGLPAFAFKHYLPQFSFWRRVALFTALTIMVGVLCVQFAEMERPLLYLTTIGFIPGYVLLLVFMLATSIMVPLTVFSLVTSQRSNSHQNLIQMLIFSVIYLSNIFMLWATEREYLHWDIYLIPPQVLLFLSAVLGLWGLKYTGRLDAYIPLNPVGRMMYLVLFFFSASTLVYVYAVDNDIMLVALDKMIIFMHLSYATFFTLYLFSNFFDLMDRNLDLKQVVFQPKRMPLITVHGFALAALLGLSYNEAFLTFDQSRAGYYNMVGDYNFIRSQWRLAQEAYEKGKFFDNTNHKGNYALSAIMGELGNFNKQAYYLSLTQTGQPSVQSFIKLSELRLQEGDYFRALFAAQKGMEEFPESGRMAINMAKLYEYKEMSDSVFYYYNRASQKGLTEYMAATNMLSYGIRQGIAADSAEQMTAEAPDYRPYAINQLALYNRKGAWTGDSLRRDWVPTGVLSDPDFAYINNLSVNRARQDTATLPFLDSLLTLEGNKPYAPQLVGLKALPYYYNGKKVEAMHLLRPYWRDTRRAAQGYGNILALWMLREGNPRQAAAMFERLNRSDDVQKATYLAFALSQAGMKTDAIRIWQQLANSLDGPTSQHAELMIQLLTYNSAEELPELSDRKRYLFNHFRIEELPYEKLWSNFQKIAEQPYKAKARLDLMNWARQRGQLDLCQQLYEQAELPEGRLGLQKDLRLSYLKTLALSSAWQELDQAYGQLPFDLDRADTLFFEAALAEQAGDSSRATSYYLRVTEELPFETHYIGYALDFLNQRMEPKIVYEKLTPIAQLLPYNLSIKKYYILQSARLGQTYFAEKELEDLENVLPAGEYQELEARYEELKSAYFERIINE